MKILSNATKANMVLKADDLSVIVEENIQSLEKYDYIIDAIIIANPNEAVYTLLYEKLSATNKYKFKVFSTREAAYHWLTNQN